MLALNSSCCCLQSFFKNFKVALNRIEHIDLLLEHLSLGHNRLLEFFEQTLIVIAQFECCVLQVNRLWLEDLSLLVVRLRQCVKLRSRWVFLTPLLIGSVHLLNVLNQGRQLARIISIATRQPTDWFYWALTAALHHWVDNRGLEIRIGLSFILCILARFGFWPLIGLPNEDFGLVGFESLAL